ncbi:MAG: TlpA family protein disulfide reductase [Anaerolineales bacterium]|nr:TlpA family protein disulfide reductase [Anaerolineales bacterium]
MAELTGQLPSTPAQLLSQLINGELVVQTMAAAGVQGPTADDALGQFLTTTALPVLAVDQALGAVPRTHFADYLARLYGVNAFVRQQAALSAGTADEYVRTLQNTAQISYGPAAMSIFAPSSDPSPVAQSTPEAGLETADQPTPAPILPEARGAQIGQLAPHFALPGLAPDGIQFTLDGLAGQPVVLSFWTTWCPYCRQQTPVLVDGYARYAQAGVQFVGIDVQEDEALVAAYRAEHQIPYPLALDRDGAVAGQYAVNGYPTTYFLDKDGRIRSTHVGALTPTQLETYVEQLLDAKP